MLKKTISILLCLILVISLPAPTVCAVEGTTEVVYLEDGSYITTTIQSYSTYSTYEMTAKKTQTYTLQNGVVCWDIVLTGTFVYDGTTCECTASNVNIIVYEDGWATYSRRSGRDDNYCFSNVVMRYTNIAGIVATSVPCNMTLTCDVNGNLS